MVGWCGIGWALKRFWVNMCEINLKSTEFGLGQKENQTLAQLRDTLLPKLMSGEIRVKDAEQEVGAIA